MRPATWTADETVGLHRSAQTVPGRWQTACVGEWFVDVNIVNSAPWWRIVTVWAGISYGQPTRAVQQKNKS